MDCFALRALEVCYDDCMLSHGSQSMTGSFGSSRFCPCVSLSFSLVSLGFAARCAFGQCVVHFPSSPPLFPSRHPLDFVFADTEVPDMDVATRVRPDEMVEKVFRLFESSVLVYLGSVIWSALMQHERNENSSAGAWNASVAVVLGWVGGGWWRLLTWKFVTVIRG